MALTINSNPMAAKAAKNLSRTYGLLSTSVERLSSGLRINSASDDPVGMGIREMMRSDIAVYQQGIRNTADAISMLQLADNSLGSIDTMLTRMRELAEQAANGTYTDTQREIINSEYQAMANEIDRIANAATFNGVKLLDGSLSSINGGQGMMIHFGASSNPNQDYYNVSLGDIRATSSTGLRVGGDAKNDIWAQGGAAMKYGSSEGCCAGGFDNLTGNAGFTAGAALSFGYNWDWAAANETDLRGGKYTAGVWQVSASESLQSLVNRVNEGTQARVGVSFANATTTSATILGADRATMSAFAVCFDDEAYFVGIEAALTAEMGAGKTATRITTAGNNLAANLTSSINNNADSKFWSMLDTTDNTVYVFAKDGGTGANSFLAGEIAADTGAAAAVQTARDLISFVNVGTGTTNQSGASFSLGGEDWGRMHAVESRPGVWNAVLQGRDTGDGRDLWIADIGGTADNDLVASAEGVYRLLGMKTGANAMTNIAGLNRASFTQVQDAAYGDWAGADIRTQANAQAALDAIADAITNKDSLRSNLGAMMNRLENTMASLETQVEGLQTAESRISDVDVAYEVAEFTKNNIKAQTAASILAQANSLPQLALMLL